jgi:hypothetical protein
MQDDEVKVEPQPAVEGPEAEVAPPTPEPQPEQVIEVPVAETAHESEPIPESKAPEPTLEPTPVPETPPPTPEPEQAPIAELTPPVATEPPPVLVEVKVEEVPTPTPGLTPVEPSKHPDPATVEPPKPTPEPPKEEPVVAPPPPTPEPEAGMNGIPQKVLDLTPEELDAARRFWISNNIRSIQKLSTKARHTRKLDLLNEVESFVHSNAPVKLSKVAYELNISEPKASDYLRLLTKANRIKAIGNTTNRYYQ